MESSIDGMDGWGGLAFGGCCFCAPERLVGQTLRGLDRKAQATPQPRLLKPRDSRRFALG